MATARGYTGASTSRDLYASNRYMLENDDAHDVIFQVRNADQLPSDDVTPGTTNYEQFILLRAHMYMLRARCPELATLAVEQQQSNGGGTGGEPPRVLVDDVTPVAFGEMLRYIYYEKVQLTQVNVFDVLLIARRYSLPQLDQICVSYIRRTIAVPTVCNALERSLRLKDKSLQAACTHFISVHTKQVLNDASFLHAHPTVVDIIASLDYLGVSEVDLYLRCVEWARMTSSLPNGDELSGAELRQALGDIIINKRIRFPTMTLGEFRMHVVGLGILEPAETLDVYNYLSYKGGGKPETQFNAIPRHKQQEQAVEIFLQQGDGRGYQQGDRTQRNGDETGRQDKERSRQDGGQGGQTMREGGGGTARQSGAYQKNTARQTDQNWNAVERRGASTRNKTPNDMSSTVYREVFFSW